jgi:diacylglycerol kinase (ATP)
MRQVVVAVNPVAGTGGSARVGPLVVEELRSAGLAVRVVAAPDERTLGDRLRREVEAGLDGVVVVGGDGIVNLAVGVLAGSGVALGIVPAGTGNDAARELGVPLGDAIDACRRIVAAFDAPARLVDVGVIEPVGRPGERRLFLCAVSAGIDALINERANTLRFPRGPQRYTVALLVELVRLRPRRYRVTVDGVEHVVDSVLLAIANLGSIGGGMRIVPFASATDGRLDALVVAPVGRLRFLRLFPRVFAGRHTDLDVVSFLSGREMIVDVDEPVVAYADGERIGPLPVRIGLREGALRVLI